LYKQRWQIELFFKWIKQNLKIKPFYGTSENAVKLQVLVAMISYVLLRLIQQGAAPERRLGEVSIRLRSVLMQRMPLMAVSGNHRICRMIRSSWGWSCCCATRYFST
tara:strand:- start:1766 stop:2086 length:321 start_codon:yes stop_codon:yes gene_type:complete